MSRCYIVSIDFINSEQYFYNKNLKVISKIEPFTFVHLLKEHFFKNENLKKQKLGRRMERKRKRWLNINLRFMD